MKQDVPKSVQKSRGAKLGFIAIAVVAACVLGFYFIPSLHREHAPVGGAQSAVMENTQSLRHEGDKISVPDGSTYRDRISIVPVEPRNLEQTLVVPSIVEADPSHVFNVLPPLGGRITSLKVGLGDHVTAGEPLVTIDSGDLASANSDVEKARSQVDLTHRALERARGLTKAGGGAVKDIESAANDAAQAEAELSRAQTRLETIAGSVATSGGRTFIVASPAAGTVTSLSASAGGYINDPTQPMMTISDLSKIWVTANIPEKDLGFVSKGQAVTVKFAAYPDETFSGTVLFINDILEPDTRRTKVRIGFANPEARLKPNMFATVTFHAPPRSVIFVPDSALLMNNDTTSVFVETSPWTFMRRVVQPGFGANGETVISDGLKPGERIVSRGGVLLND